MNFDLRDICLHLEKHQAMRQLLIILFSSICCGAGAQQQLTLNEAFSLALEHNKMLDSRHSDVTTAYYELRAARGLYYPKVELIGAYVLTDRDMDINLSGKNGAIESGANALIGQGIANGLITPAIGDMLRSLLSPLRALNLNYTLQKRSFGLLAAKVTMPLYAGGRIRAANRAAAIKLSMTEYKLDAAKSHLYTTLVEQYFGVVLLRYAVDVRHAVFNAVVKHLEDAKALEEEGVIAHSEVLAVEYRLAEVRRDLASEEHRLHMAQRALNTTLGIKDEVVPIDELFIGNSSLTIDYYIDNAINLNSALSDAKLNIDLAHEGVVSAKAELLPTVGIIGGGSLYDYQLSDILPRWVVGIEASITLFDGLSKENNLRAAKSRVDSVNSAVENGRDEIVLLAENEYYNMINALSDIAASRSSIATADSYYYSALEGFRAGVVSSSDLIDAEVARAAAMLTLLNASYEYCCSLARLLEVSALSHTFDTYRENGEIIDIKSGLINQ